MLLRIILLSCFLYPAAFSSSAASFNPLEKNIDDIKIYYAYDDFLPIISMNIAIKNSGIAYVDEDLVGINAVVSYLANNFLFLQDQRERFSSELSARNIGVSFKSDKENFYITLKFMSSDIAFITEFLQHFFYKFEVTKESVAKAKEYLSYNRDNSYLNSNFVSYQNFSQNFFDERFRRNGFMRDDNYDKINIEAVNQFVENLADKEQLKIAIAGDLKEGKLDGFIKGLFEEFEAKSGTDEYQAELIRSANQEIQLEGYDQVIFYSGIAGPSRTDKDFYAFYIFNHLFGGSPRNSLIGIRLREEAGLTYSGYSYVNYFRDLGYLTVYFACDKAKYQQASAVIADLLSDIKTHKFTEAELAVAKQYLMGKYDIAFSSNSRISGFMLGLLVHDLPVSMLKDRNKFVEDVSLEDIHRIRDKLFLENDFMTVVTGDLD
ncbi:MAG: insulinase family protein [Rickettsiales bacterium]|jgi:zinc protease|nr:insulinase family protein [Rickettsiales bacterium]